MTLAVGPRGNQDVLSADVFSWSELPELLAAEALFESGSDLPRLSAAPIVAAHDEDEDADEDEEDLEDDDDEDEYEDDEEEESEEEEGEEEEDDDFEDDDDEWEEVEDDEDEEEEEEEEEDDDWEDDEDEDWEEEDEDYKDLSFRGFDSRRIVVEFQLREPSATIDDDRQLLPGRGQPPHHVVLISEFGPVDHHDSIADDQPAASRR